MSKLTHLDEKGEAAMVDVSEKAITDRIAIAEGQIVMLPETLRLIREGNAKKGDVLGAARIAGIMAAKKTHELIPLCHPLLISKIAIDLEPDEALPGIRVRATVKLSGQTGVEMEALTAVSVTGLTLIDMIKAMDPHAAIRDVQVETKSGGKTGDWKR